MNIFITEHTIEGDLFEGPRFEASSWAEAEAKAQELGVTLVGRLG